jgi:hypothetical protein
MRGVGSIIVKLQDKPIRRTIAVGMILDNLGKGRCRRRDGDEEAEQQAFHDSSLRQG